MQRLVALARYTMAELVIRKIILFACLLFFCSHALGYVVGLLTVGNPLKIFIDFSFFGYQLFILGFVCFFVMPFYAGQQRMSFFALFLVKPITRWQFLLGTFAGHAIALLCAGLFFYVGNVMMLHYHAGHWLWHLAPAYLTLWITALFLCATALLCALFFSPAIAYFMLFTIYVLSNTNHYWSVMLMHKGGMQSLIGTAVYYLLPDLSFLDIKSAVTYQLPIALMPLLAALAYTLSFTLLFLLVALWFFRNKPIA